MLDVEWKYDQGRKERKNSMDADDGDIEYINFVR